MTKEDAMKIMCDYVSEGDEYHAIDGFIEDTKVMVSVVEVAVNLTCNNYVLNLDYVQDFINPDNGNLVQGHTLREVKI
jgi:hypothetical protein